MSLRGFTEFSAWTDAELAELDAHLERHEVDQGFVFVTEGAASPDERRLFAVVRGDVLVQRAGRTFSMGPGSLFGVVAFVDGGPRAASVTAASRAVVLSLSHERAQRLAPALRAKLELIIARQLTRDLAAMNQQAVDAWSARSTGPSRARWVTLQSYSGLHVMRAELHEIATVRELVALLSRARKQGRRVTMHGAGLSFDSQALSADLAVRLTGFKQLEVNVEAKTMTVGVSVPWGDVIAKLEPLGLVPAVVVSGSAITVGGTLAVNAQSRFSPVWGKEGKHVESLDVLTVSGERLTVSRTKEPGLFYAAIGGFGQVAAILGATVKLKSIGPRPRIATVVERHEAPERLAAQLGCAPDASVSAETPYAVVAFKGDVTRSLVSRSRYVSDVPLRPMLPHRPANVSRVPIELAIHHIQTMGQAFWNFAYERYLEDGVTWVDELVGYTFFMDGNLRTHRTSATMGVPFRTAQQTFVLPKPEQLAPFIARSRALTLSAGLELALVDVLYLPEDEPFALSSSHGGGGYAVTLTFEGVDGVEKAGVVRELCVDLSSEIFAQGGRVHLTKNVFARPEELRRMYATGLAQLEAARRTYDPTSLLTSDFLERLFPGR